MLPVMEITLLLVHTTSMGTDNWGLRFFDIEDNLYHYTAIYERF